MVNNFCKVQINHFRSIFLKIKKIWILFRIEIFQIKKKHLFFQEMVGDKIFNRDFYIDIKGKIPTVNLLSNVYKQDDIYK
jgi:hypothetical protein